MPRTHALALAVSALAGSAHAIDVVFVHDQINDEVLRLIDRNGDGDALDPGEATVFLDDSLPPKLGNDNAQGLVALGPDAALATDNFEPDNITRSVDANNDGDALDPGETTLWFGGPLPGGFPLANPAELRSIGDGGFLLLANNTLDTDNPEAVYRLEDTSGDGAIDAGEITTLAEFSPPGVSLTTTFDIVRGTDGALYTIDISDPNQIVSLDILDPGATTKREWFDSVDLLLLTGYSLSFTINELEHIAATGEVVFGASRSAGSAILAARDADGSGLIDTAGEVRVLWDEGASADAPSTGSPRDLVLAPDGSMYFSDGLQDSIWRLIDRNGDGDYNDAGETTVYYDGALAGTAGLPPISQPQALAVWGCAADLAEPLGVLDLADIQAFVNAFTGSEPLADTNGDGVWDLADIQGFVVAFTAGCP